jgi:hypothetical protein
MGTCTRRRRLLVWLKYISYSANKKWLQLSAWVFWRLTTMLQ